MLVATAQDTRTFSGVLPITQVLRWAKGAPCAGHQAMLLIPTTSWECNPCQEFQQGLFETSDTAQEAKLDMHTIWDAEKTAVCSNPTGADDYLTLQGGLPACRPHKPAMANCDPAL